MKRIAFLVILSVFVSGSAMAEINDAPTNKELVVNDEGIVSFIEKNENRRPLTQEEQTAFDNPGQETPIDLKFSGYKRVDFWHVAPIREYTKVAVFKDGKLQTITKTEKVEGQPEPAVYVILSLVAILLMLISNFLMVVKGNEKSIFITFGIAVTITTIITTIIATATFTAFAIVVYTFAIVALILAMEEDNFKPYWVFSLIFYILMIVVIFL